MQTALEPELDMPVPWSCIGRPATTARDKLLNTATELFCHNGFTATGVDIIVQRSGAAKSTLYSHFKSKENLIAAVLDREGQAWRDWFFGRLNETPGTPADKLATVFDILQEWFEHPEFYGCPFLNAITESTTGKQARLAAAAHKSHLNLWIKAQAIELGHKDPDGFVEEMIVLIDGAIVAAQATGSVAFAQTAKRIAASRARRDVAPS